MATLRIYDLDRGALAVDLLDLLDLLAPRSLHAEWTVLPVATREPCGGGFEATGSGGEQLEMLADVRAQVAGRDLAMLAKVTGQVIWGEFVGVLPGMTGTWVTIRAIDSTFYEV